MDGWGGSAVGPVDQHCKPNHDTPFDMANPTVDPTHQPSSESDRDRVRWRTPPPIDHADWLSGDGSAIISSADNSLPGGDEMTRRLVRSGVNEIVLLHGTFVGSDVLGVARILSRLSPSLAETIATATKSFMDSQMGWLGNFDAGFVSLLQRLIRPPAHHPIDIRRMIWSGENHHLGRIDAVIHLLANYLNQDNERRRVLVLAHSHGGNVMAMATSLIGGDMTLRQKIVDGLRNQYIMPLIGRLERPVWQDVCQALTDPMMRWPTFDVVTLGTPLRYRFGRGRGHLLHWVNHHPVDPEQPAKAVLPRWPSDLLEATGGDYVQQFGTAGTDFFPPAVAGRDWFSDRRVKQYFEPESTSRFNLAAMWRRIASGNRIAADGVTVLCDYPRDRFGAYRNLLGHAVYTHPMYLPYHVREMTTLLYDDKP